MADSIHQIFVEHLLQWYSQSNRPMPWKGIKDPYLIWISEIILQQTRVEQGWNYFIKFKDRFPDVFTLAKASEDEVLKYWEGLGYYSRARNLHFTARTIVEKYNGIFPDDYERIISLKGIGTYTASAIASFAFSKPFAVVDGNVNRVLSRIFEVDIPIDSNLGKKTFLELATQCIKLSNDPALYNQAIMDFGATVCKPQNPLCHNCLNKLICKAYLNGRINELPVKTQKILKRTRYFQYYVIRQGDSVYIQQRINKDIWKQLFHFPLVETQSLQEPDPHKFVEDKSYITSINNSMRTYKQKLTHQDIVASFCEIQVSFKWKTENKDWVLVNKKDLNTYAFPKIINEYLYNQQIPLNLR